MPSAAHASRCLSLAVHLFTPGKSGALGSRRRTIFSTSGQAQSETLAILSRAFVFVPRARISLRIISMSRFFNAKATETSIPVACRSKESVRNGSGCASARARTLSVDYHRFDTSVHACPAPDCLLAGGASPTYAVPSTLLNYFPNRILYVSEPFENSIAAVDLTDDGVIFRMGGARHLCSEALDHPVDLAPVVQETSDPNWASNTTLDVQSDFYVANRGNNTIVRIRQDGAVVAMRRVRLPGGRSLGNGRLNGIATSPDGSRIWVTVTGRLPGHGKLGDYVLELPSF